MMKRVVLSLFALFVLSACGADEAAPAGRRVTVEVTASGYEPAEVSATVGEPLTLVVTRTSDEGCGDVLAIPSQDISEELPLNEAVEISFTPREAGELRFTCGMNMYDGAIVVTQ